MEYLRVGLTTIFSIAVLFIVTRFIGGRQLNQLTMFDYVNGITIGSIAAELAVAEGKEFWFWTEALILYGLVTLLLSVLTDRFIKLRRLTVGKAVILMRGGVLYDENFRDARVDLNEFQMQLRNNGYFQMDELDTVLMEANGKLSILPKTPNRPATPSDLSTPVEQERLQVNIILDGQVLEDNLTACGRDQNWLKKQLDEQHFKLSEVFLGTYTPENQLSLYKRGGKLADRFIE